MTLTQRACGFALIMTTAHAAHSDCCPGRAFHFDVSSPTSDVYRIAIQPASSNLPAGVHAVRSDSTALRVDPSEGRIEVVRFDAPGNAIAWSGAVAPIAAFGRAAVPGVELAWKASPDEAIYGAGERFDALNQAGRKVDFWIKDAPGQDGAATYYCTPVFYSSAGYGIFFTNNPEAFADFNSDGSGAHRYQRAGTAATFYVTVRTSIKEQVRARAAIQGPYRGIPDWAWGPWISRNSYENQAEAEEAIRGMIDRDMPVSVIVQEAWKGSSEAGEFNSFSTQRWPNLASFLDLCEEHDIKNVLWQVPIVHPSHPGFDDAARSGFFVRKPDGSVSFRQEWLAGFANIDFTNPEAVAYWKAQMRATVRLGIAGFKADDGEDIKPDDVFHDGRRGWQMHNEYSALYGRALMELLDEEDADGMLWSRSGSLGIETCPALWAGDQGARWDQLQSLVPAGLSASISGMPFWGHDIGGYFGDCTPELYIRWLQYGAFSPLMQYHGVKRREPWEFGPEAERAYKLLSHLRMNLRPTLIALGREAAETGMPIMRPMALEFPDDPRFASEHTQYMLGPDLLVAPVLEEGAKGRRVKFPAGRWQHLLFPIAYEGPAERAVAIERVDVPVFVREGATIDVQAEGKLGCWTKDDPVRSMTFAPERATIVNPPVMPSLSVVYDESRVIGPGQRTVRTRARNISDVPMPISITMLPTTVVEQVLAPNSEQDQVWKVHFDSDEAVGDVRVAFSISGVETVEASFVRAPRWAVVGPFPAEPKQAHGIHYPPEWEQGADVAFEAGYRLVHWQAVPAAHLVKNDGLDFKALLGDRDHAAAYALAFLDAEREMDAELRFGSDDTLTVWLNDEQVHSVESYRLAAYDQEIVKVRLKAGNNKLLVKVAQDVNPWRLVFRLTGHGGSVIDGVSDGFNDIADFAPDRAMASRVVQPPEPLTWQLKGPRSEKSVASHQVIDLSAELGACNDCSAEARTSLVVDRATPVEFVCGSDDGLVLQLNGVTLLATNVPRGFVLGSDRVRATLKAGTNSIACRIFQGGGDWKFKVEAWDVSAEPARLLHR